MKLLNAESLAQAREKLAAVAEKIPVRREVISRREALGRIAGRDIAAAENIPSFRRSAVDGYGVKWQETVGASEGIPVFFQLREAVAMGKSAACVLKTGECSYVPTGGMVPEGADAVVMTEYCEVFGPEEVAVYRPCAPGENVVRIGEDISVGEILIKRGTRIRSQEIGALAALGLETVEVVQPWRVAVISTGDELTDSFSEPDAPLLPGKIRDINTDLLEAVCLETGFAVTAKRVIPDDPELLEAAIREALPENDVVIVSGGSSKGDRDYTRQAIETATGNPVLVHGIAMKPGKPTILAWDEKNRTVAAGLPGHPAAAAMVFRLLIADLYRKRTGQAAEKAVTAVLTENVAAAPGRTTCVFVELEEGENGYRAIPVYGKSGTITLLTRAWGYGLLNREEEGRKAGDRIRIFPL